MMRRSILASLVICPLLASAADRPAATLVDPGAVTPVENPIEIPPLAFSRPWIMAEVLIFERPQVPADALGERLLVDQEPMLSPDIRSYEPLPADAAPQTVRYGTGHALASCWLASGDAPPDAAAGPPAAFAQPFLTEFPPDPEPADSDGLALDDPDATSRATEGGETAARLPGDIAAVEQVEDPTKNEAEAAGPVGSMVIAESEMAQEPPDPRETVRAEFAQYEAELETASLSWLPDSWHLLSSEARRLSTNGGYRVLFHQAWIEVVERRGSAPTRLVLAEATQPFRGDQGTAPPAREPSGLIGELRLLRGRGTRFTADLWFRPTEIPTSVPGYMHLREERRLSEGALFYLDHPRLGVLVRITSLPVPAALEAAWQSANESAGAMTVNAPELSR